MNEWNSHNLLEKIVKGEDITQKDIEDELYEICESEHASCNNECPVYKLVMTKKEQDNLSRNGCPYFKSGSEMLRALEGYHGVNSDEDE